MFRQGPVFTNLLLADEVNRTPPKTQAALLEAMEERQVTVEGTTHLLPDPFLVIATQNPVEYEGTYPLPEAQLDRFLFKLDVGYPSAAEELDVLVPPRPGPRPPRHRRRRRAAGGQRGRPGARPGGRRPAAGRAAGARVHRRGRAGHAGVAVAVARRVAPRRHLRCCTRPRPGRGCSGRDYVTPDEVKAVAKPTLRHRLMVRPELELEGVTPDGVLDGVLATVPVPR